MVCMRPFIVTWLNRNVGKMERMRVIRRMAPFPVSVDAVGHDTYGLRMKYVSCIMQRYHEIRRPQ
jgi:hypothetical protein